jgi:hypothetical protein
MYQKSRPKNKTAPSNAKYLALFSSADSSLTIKRVYLLNDMCVAIVLAHFTVDIQAAFLLKLMDGNTF